MFIHSPRLVRIAAMLVPLCLALSSRAAEAWCIANQTDQPIFIRLQEEPAGLYLRAFEIASGTNPCETILFADPEKALTLVVESAHYRFQGVVPMRAGGHAIVGLKSRAALGVSVPLVYAESFNSSGTVIGRDPLWAHDDSPNQPRNVRFAATADPQYWDVPGNADVAKHKVLADKLMNMSRVLLGMHRRGVLVAGDLTQNASLNEHDWYNFAMAGQKRFFFDGLGNHDYWQGTNTCDIGTICQQVRDRLRSTTVTKRADGNAPHYSWDWGDVHFVQLNLMASDRVTSDSQFASLDPLNALSFLQQDLAQHVGSSGRPVVLIHHYGFDGFSTNYGTDDGEAMWPENTTTTPPTPAKSKELWWDGDQRKEYWEAIAPYHVVAVVSGHVHSPIDSSGVFLDWTRPAGVTVGPEKILNFVAGSARGNAASDRTGSMVDALFLGDWLHLQRLDDQGLGAHNGSAYPSKKIFFGEPDVEIEPVPVVCTTGMSCIFTFNATAMFPVVDAVAEPAPADQVRYKWVTGSCTPASVSGSDTATLTITLNSYQVCHPVVQVTNAYGGKVGEASVQIEHVAQAPTISGMPANLIVPVEGPAGGRAFWNPPTASDLQDIVAPVTCLPVSGTMFPRGTTTVTCTAEDLDDNVARATFTVTVTDTTKPEVQVRIWPPANAAGWHSSPPTVEWTVYEIGGIASKTGCVNTQVNSETPGTTFACSVVDLAGNVQSKSVTIKLDSTPPVVTFGQPTTTPNEHGWYQRSVAMPYSVADAGSGLHVDTAPAGTLTFEVDGKGVTSKVFAFDLAGNLTVAVSPGVNIDRVAPRIFTRVAGPRGRGGWYRGDVFVEFVCSDAHSGIASCSPEAVVTGEGQGFSANGTAVDLAGNEASVTEANINMDRTPPVVTVARTPANAHGWNNGPVWVGVTAADAISGIHSIDQVALPEPGPVVAREFTFSTEGKNHFVALYFEDAAGNAAEGVVNDILIDLTPPTITAIRDSSPNGNGWYNGDVFVIFDCRDTLSSIASCSPEERLGGEGANLSSTGVAEDRAGNRATLVEGPIRIDRTRPVVNISRSVPANAYGWNKDAVTVTFEASDPLSGVAGTTSRSTTFTAEGASHLAQAEFSDLAGNVRVIADNVRIDRTPPLITAARDRAPNAHNWYNASVVVTFTCTDGLSQLETCSSPGTVVAQGANRSSTGVAVDRAGNQATVVEAGINLDFTPPVVTAVRQTLPDSRGWNGTPVVVAFNAEDPLSGLNGAASGTVTVSGEGAGQEARLAFGDLAGNSATGAIGGINIDLTAPALTVPADLTVEATGAAGAVVPAAVVGMATATDSVGTVTVTRFPQGNAFALGTTLIAWTASDGTHQSQGVQRLTVADTTRPVVTVPAPITLDATGANGASVPFTATATDAVSPVSAACAPASGSVFAVGTTTVTCRATDAANNTGTATFVVTVNDVSTPGVMQGDGFVRADDQRYDFEFLVIERARIGERGFLTLEVKDERPRNRRDRRGDSSPDRFVAQNIDFVKFSDDPTYRPGRSRRPMVDTVRFTGTGSWNRSGGYRFEVLASDHGEPGRRHSETVSITVWDPSGNVVARVDGEIDGGNVQSRRIH